VTSPSEQWIIGAGSLGSLRDMVSGEGEAEAPITAGKRKRPRDSGRRRHTVGCGGPVGCGAGIVWSRTGAGGSDAGAFGSREGIVGSRAGPVGSRSRTTGSSPGAAESRADRSGAIGSPLRAPRLFHRNTSLSRSLIAIPNDQDVKFHLPVTQYGNVRY
jgi:hypothetical protein